MLAHCNGSLTVYDQTNEREIYRRFINMPKEIDLPVGNGRATVQATRGFKQWFSTRERGLTVESTMSVSAECGQSHDEIMNAGAAVGELAVQLADNGLAQMQEEFLDVWVKQVTRQGRG